MLLYIALTFWCYCTIPGRFDETVQYLDVLMLLYNTWTFLMLLYNVWTF